MPPQGVTVAGNPAPIRVAEQLDNSVVEAPELRQTWRGERVGMFAAYPAMLNGAVRGTIRQDGAAATAEIVFKGKTVVDTVEIDFHASQRDWWQAPVYAALTGADRLSIMGQLQAIEKYAGEGHTAAEVAAEAARLAAQLTGDQANAFDDILLNGESYLALLPVVTFTRVVSLDFGTPYEILDIGKVFSTAAMNANVPLNPQFVVTEIVNTIGANSGQTLGWLKTGRYAISSDGSAQYIQQYVFDAYRTSGYTFVA